MDTKPTNVFETEDVATVAYLLMEGVEMLRYKRWRNKMTWYFIDADESNGMTKCQRLHVEFLNSRCKRYDSFIRDVKKMLRREPDGDLRDKG